jgi:hypothetical protein
MNTEQHPVGPLQLVIVGFETTERFRGDIARELTYLRGRGMIRVLDARFFHRAADGKLTEVDLGPLLADRPREEGNPVAHLLGVNGAGSNGGFRGPEAFTRTAGFALEDLRRLTDEIGPGDHVAAVLVEHVWASHLRETVREAGGRLIGQGFLTEELAMVVGAEIQARADAELALELADEARGAALVDALAVLAPGQRGTASERAGAAAEVVRVLVGEGFLASAEAPAAVDALATAGLIETAALEAAVAEAEDLLRRRGDEPPRDDAD